MLNSTRVKFAPPNFKVIKKHDWTRVMPRKIRELIRQLERAGFADRGGRGSHRNFEHPQGVRVTISGKQGDDAKPYQEREVQQAIADAELGNGNQENE